MRNLRFRRKNKLFFFLSFLLLLTLILLFITERRLSPIIMAIGTQRAHMAAAQIVQSAVNEEFAGLQLTATYSEFMYIEKDKEGRVILMMPDVVKINLLVSSLVLDIEERLRQMKREEINIPVGAVTGMRLFSSLGPNVKVLIRPIGHVEIRIVDDFTDAGINQTRHRIWLEVVTQMSIAIPFDSKKFDLTTSVLLCEGIIIGPVPETYLNFDFFK
ncbi:MAG: sporulation protein YunB [Clostridiales bacterium]|nr:sporulation protein YunB [Clostridiales bacterium]